MPLFLDVEVPDALQKWGSIPAPSMSTAASTATLSTIDKVGADNNALLAKLHSAPIFAPTGPHPFCTGACAPTKTKIMTKRKVDKEAKAAAVD